MRLLNRTDRVGLLVNVGAAMLVVAAANGIVFLWNPREMKAPISSGFDVPGYVVGIVWTFLFVALAMARWLILRRTDGQKQGTAVIALLLFCAAYPIYTTGLHSVTAGLVGNILTIACALWVVWRVRQTSPSAAALVSSVVVWVIFATVLTVRDLGNTH